MVFTWDKPMNEGKVLRNTRWITGRGKSWATPKGTVGQFSGRKLNVSAAALKKSLIGSNQQKLDYNGTIHHYNCFTVLSITMELSWDFAFSGLGTQKTRSHHPRVHGWPGWKHPLTRCFRIRPANSFEDLAGLPGSAENDVHHFTSNKPRPTGAPQEQPVTSQTTQG